MLERCENAITESRTDTEALDYPASKTYTRTVSEETLANGETQAELSHDNFKPDGKCNHIGNLHSLVIDILDYDYEEDLGVIDGKQLSPVEHRIASSCTQIDALLGNSGVEDDLFSGKQNASPKESTKILGFYKSFKTGVTDLVCDISPRLPILSLASLLL